MVVIRFTVSVTELDALDLSITYAAVYNEIMKAT
jgi:hypothetical protein